MKTVKDTRRLPLWAREKTENRLVRFTEKDKMWSGEKKRNNDKAQDTTMWSY